MLQAVVSLAMLLVFQLLAVVGMYLGGRTKGTRTLLLILGALVLLSLASAQVGWLPWLLSAVWAGLWVRRQLERGTTLWRTTFVALIPALLATGLPFLFASTDEAKLEVERYVSEVLAPDAAEDSGPEARALAEQTEELARDATLWLIRLLPAELLVFNLAEVLCVVVIGAAMARRAGARVAVPPVSQWRVPFGTAWALAAGLALAATRTQTGTVIGLNVVVVSAALLAIQGFAVLLAFLERSIPFAARCALLILGALTALPFLLVGAAFLGLLDLWVDFRRPRLRHTDST